MNHIFNEEYRGMTNKELIDTEAALDYNDGDLLTVLFERAEEYIPGIEQRYNDAVSGDSREFPDDVKEEALAVLAKRPDYKF